MIDSRPPIPNCLLRDQQSTITKSTIASVLAQRLVESFSRLLSGGSRFRNLPLHLAGTNFILRDAARLGGICVDHGRRTGLKLPRPPCCHQNVSVIAVKAFDQLHWDSPFNQVRSLIIAERRTSETRPTFWLVPRDAICGFRRPVRRH